MQEGDYFALDYCGDKVARLNKGLCKHLRGLISRVPVQIRGYVPDEHWSRIAQQDVCHPSTILPLEINVYGTREDAEEAGSILSRAGIFLQRPLYGLDGVDYHNPHLLQVEAHPEVLTTPPLPVTQDSIVTPGLHVETSAQVNESIDSILDSLTHHVDTQEIPVDGRIKTKLLE